MAAGVADFIEVYDDALDRASCAAIVERLRGSDALKPGRVGSGVFPELKHSRDLGLQGRPEWADVEAALNRAVFAGVLSYVRRYPQALVSPLMLQIADGGAPRRLTADDVAAMDDAALAPLLQSCLRPGAINLQWYAAGEGGYPYWHCELYPRDPGGETLHRHLLWTLYLNDGFDAGETEFLFQQRRVAPRTGSLLIAPTAFTHTHRGNRPRGGDKVIATSWILFQRAERLFAG
ncbi:MAG: 2OG-Fe(II) oxygenase [Luteimonas sp.]